MVETSKRRASRGEDALPPTSVAGPTVGSSPSIAPSIEGQQEPPQRPISISSTSFRVPDQPRSSSTSAGEVHHPAKAAKVAIPRLKKDGEGAFSDPTKSGGRHRVNHACEPCRQRKTKCSGERPICKHCQDFKINCYYADGKRDRVKKQFGTMSEKLADYETLLRDLSTRVGEKDAEMIQKALEKETSKELDSPTAIQSALPPDIDAEASGEESEVSGNAGSTGALDRIEEDFNRNEDSRATGFMGKNSEITWMQRLRQENRLGSPTRYDSDRDFRERSGGASALFSHRQEPDSGPPLSDMYEDYSVTESSYHLDDFPVSIPDTVDPYELPPKEMADNLFGVYMSTVHPSFPIIGRATFTSQYRRFFSGPRVNPGHKWLAILNLIFSISARYSHLISASWRGDERDHLIYFTRARQLSMNGDTLFSHADLQQVQVEGLTAFYLTATNQINRSWAIHGMAIRAAVSLGLNMRNESTKTPDTSKEIRYRVWWALYILEQQLSMLTGRPTSILDHVCTAPLPVPYEEDNFSNPNAAHLLGAEMQKTSRFPISRSTSISLPGSTPSSERSGSVSASKITPPTGSPSGQSTATGIGDWTKEASPNLSLYFLHLVELTRIKQDILNRLYTPEAMNTTWSAIQGSIGSLDERLNNWLAALPTIFDFTRKQRDQSFLQQRISLGFLFYGTRITINRPCLCRLDRKLPRQSNKSKDFNRTAAMTCIDAARAMLDLIPDQPNAIGLNKLSPWWCILHFLVQATTVLMLEVSFRADHMPEQAENLLEASKKGVRWLYQLSEESLAASRAWKLCDSLLRDAAPKVGGNVDDLPTALPHPTDPVAGVAPGMQLQPAIDLSFAPSTMSRYPAMQGQLNVPLYTGYDQYMPQNAMTQPDGYYPITAEMDFLTDEFHEAQTTQRYGMHHQEPPS